MPKGTPGAVLLTTALVGAVLAAVFVANLGRIADRFERPDDDPQFFCNMPDPSPVAEANATSLLLQDCAAGKTFTLPRGETIAIDLATGGRFDPGAEFHDLAVTDRSILQTVSAPRTIDVGTRDGTPAFDYFAIYQAVHSGRVTISALYRRCFDGKCYEPVQWEATVQVS